MRAEEATEERAEEKVLDDKCVELLRVCREFWELQGKLTNSGAVKWVTFHDGSVLIYTRGEYLGQLMKNIPSLGETITFANYQEVEE